MPAPHVKLKVFVDADVIFAGSTAPSEHGASHVVLRMGEITLLDCITSAQAITEVERNLQEKLPAKLPEFHLIVNRSLRVVADPEFGELSAYRGHAEPEDLPLLVAALRETRPYFLTFNLRHYHPRGLPIRVMRPGDFLAAVRERLTALAANKE
ncbi:MAG: hypothetical protein HY741_20840 [Chloroflexi bacterium]|nr:hypothetical protein [Chloroflexota bacterium]